MKGLVQKCRSLLVYRDVFEDAISGAFLTVLENLDRPEIAIRAYADWFSALAKLRQGWKDYLLNRILLSENAFTQQAHESFIPDELIHAVRRDARILQEVYQLGCAQFAELLDLVPWRDHLIQVDSRSRYQEFERIQKRLEVSEDWAGEFIELLSFYRKFGTGRFAEYSAFRWQNGKLNAIATPDPVRIDALVGYESQRDQLLRNTEFLLAGLPALHILLYGSRGSGKSSLVKSLLGKYENLRLIEVAKSELRDLPAIVEGLRNLPQKFVIFVDDLSFEEDDDAYKALKVVLEGNLTARPQNVVVYATSNRRHLIREFFDDRPRPRDADEIHNWDTVQEKLSFSDRFGLTLTFEPADQPTYLKIVHHLAEQAGISVDDLEFRALQWATRHNGRSGRTARQFVDFLKSELTHE
ncbi:MAG: ATP-binding protein [Leptolyngbya sp. UWPOB_LEPTO1]|uniref:ATP-binding protein n=1 Tax=Leptolyngbya sp. UWPOB_LEPTO1 TaxID=2815653 RepID=UPI001AC079AE|nr:ATP-binding protein [Leptolyngbya sp. UWPOB_LEPTO1]MBN8561295.1 ATP-binding protein [Leptolyngbya sp. UWPOB_LEPTO1]